MNRELSELKWAATYVTQRGTIRISHENDDGRENPDFTLTLMTTTSREDLERLLALGFTKLGIFGPYSSKNKYSVQTIGTFEALDLLMLLRPYFSRDTRDYVDERIAKYHSLKRKRTVLIESRKKTHCCRGHEYTEENTRYTKNGWRACRECSKHKNRTNRDILTP